MSAKRFVALLIVLIALWTALVFGLVYWLGGEQTSGAKTAAHQSTTDTTSH
jgi:hypothetical protein